MGKLFNGKGGAAAEERAYLAVSAVLFIIGAFTFWEFIYELCHMVGSISCGDPGSALREFIRMFPLILSSFIYVYLGVFIHHAYMAESVRQRARIWRVNGLITIVLGFIVVVAVVGGLVSGTYHSLVEGFISPLFPLDILLGGLIMAGFGVVALIYSSSVETNGSSLPLHAQRHCALLRFAGRIPCLLSYLVGICGFAACVYGTYVMDWKHGMIFFNIMLWLAYATAPAMLIYYRLVWAGRDGRDDAASSARLMKKSGLVFLAVNVLILVLYFVSVQMFPAAPDQNAFGILPVEFTASFNAFLPIYGLNGIAAPLTAFIKGTVRGKR